MKTFAIIEFGRVKMLSNPTKASCDFKVDSLLKAAVLANRIRFVLNPMDHSVRFQVSKKVPRIVEWSSDGLSWVAVSLGNDELCIAEGPYSGLVKRHQAARITKHRITRG